MFVLIFYALAQARVAPDIYSGANYPEAVINELINETAKLGTEEEIFEVVSVEDAVVETDSDEAVFLAQEAASIPAATQEVASVPAEAAEIKIYVVRKGDTLRTISRKFKTSITCLRASNPKIKNVHAIRVRQKIVITKGKPKQSAQHAQAERLSGQEKLAIIKNASAKYGIRWQLLAGTSKQESGLGVQMSGDHGRSVGPFHINLPSHPEISYEQAMDWRWSADWSARHLARLGVNKNQITALRKWNGSLKNPKTLVHAKRVIRYAKNTYGMEDVVTNS